MHVNSIDIDSTDGNIIASFLDMDCILKISSSDGKIMWKLGGKDDDFGLLDKQKTSRQHYAQHTDIGSITVFDNRNNQKQSRIVEYKLDEENLQLVEFKEYQVDGYFFAYTGSVQRLDDNEDVYMI